MLTNRTVRPAGVRGRWIALAVAAVVFLILLELASAHYGFTGPTVNLLHDLVGPPKSGPVLWAGLALAVVRLPPRARWTAVASAAGIDVLFAAARFAFTDDRVTFGNGALLTILGIAVLASVRWSGPRRADALKGVGLGMLLIVATKVGDAWLTITALTRPMVLDQYVQTSDRALGNPSWVMGRVVDALGPVGYQVLHTVYIELPVGAMVVALWQLRNHWPEHHLVRTFLLIGILGPLIYLVFPVVGPVFAFGADGGAWAVANVWPHRVPIDLAPHAVRFDEWTPRNCMPSLHTAWASAIFIHSRRGPRWLRILGAVWLACTLTATLGFGYHYGIDLIAGAVFCLTVESALREPGRGWGWFRWRLLLWGAAGVTAVLVATRFLAVQMATHAIPAGAALVGVLVVTILGFYATFFAEEGTPLWAWGHPGERAGAADLGERLSSA
ncbi:phosphatase PAP2 family protein [Corynebacteriales bacterium D3-21]|uniref:Phosphatase PAP2 family protein n=1 Tax=Speluncibacter jeojiensis TaxID=2710754 RepID=A0A9X4REU5_9ACTN|nr:phosphatase PAP2 family protein [Corynebacteriales bacterium D3-21]